MEILAFLPFILIIILLIGFRMSAFKAMPIVLGTTLAVVFYWGMTSAAIMASFVRASFLFSELFFLIFFAVALLYLMIETGRIKILENYLASISPDYRVQSMLIAWAFVALIEGAAGFGTPVALAAPFLVALGFPAIKAIAIGLIGDSTAVTFGAAGTPIIVGLSASGLSADQITMAYIQAAGLHLLLAIVATLSIAYIVDRKNFLEFIPFAIFSALAFSIPYFLTARFIGPELPSIIGGLTAIILISIAAKKGFMMPKQTLTFKKHKTWKPQPKKVFWAITPLLVLISLLVISRTIPFIKNILQTLKIELFNIFVTPINATILLTYTPGFFFLVTILLIKSEKKKLAFKDSWHKVKIPMLTLLMILVMTQLIFFSNLNYADIAGIPQTIALTLSNSLGKLFIFASPLIGAMGAFITGSSTVSNLLFAGIQADTAATIGINVVVLMALQLIGSAAGNMTAIHNIVTASATVGLKSGEGEIIKTTIIPAIIYCLLGAIIILLL